MHPSVIQLEAIHLCESISGDLDVAEQDWLVTLDLPCLTTLGGDLLIFAASVDGGDPFVFRCAASSHVVPLPLPVHDGDVMPSFGYVGLRTLWHGVKDALALPASPRWIKVARAGNEDDTESRWPPTSMPPSAITMRKAQFAACAQQRRNDSSATLRCAQTGFRFTRAQ